MSKNQQETFEELRIDWLTEKVNREHLEVIKDQAKKMVQLFENGHHPSFEMLERIKALIFAYEMTKEIKANERVEEQPHERT